ncbi:GNAT family N-acetyltransferase [Pontibacillus marinus]|uniref:N-acetyltransferase domain-containing protein n=1 Tax=Pontibacillus marinus BH030004 = DSM 16465 TaxID=1385511 RepID=A0A0A5FXM3_9BACI|nr:GNAT family N-acetyltransferase [Pontibacillus marinus]KGX83560.1 hypothetical protein N783_02690 [Pontibacillus marinus BH030004 = DSM 16465]
MNIQPLNHEELGEVSQWLANLNEKDNHFVAWLDSGVEAIKAQLTPLLSFESTLLWVGRDNREIVGFIGLLPFFDQKVCRLLGPFTSNVHALGSMNELWEKASPIASEYFDIVKVAFFKQNEALTKFSEQHGFYCYNSEKTLILHKEQATIHELDAHHIEPYQEKFNEDIRHLHPQAAYYTPEELLHLINEPENHLWCYVEDDHVKGYVYFEEIIGTDEGEICFVNVERGERSQGIGSVLIQFASSKAFHEFDLSLVTLSVRTGNPKAEKLYKELGFKEGSTIYAYEKELNNNLR